MDFVAVSNPSIALDHQSFAPGTFAPRILAPGTLAQGTLAQGTLAAAHDIPRQTQPVQTYSVQPYSIKSESLPPVPTTLYSIASLSAVAAVAAGIYLLSKHRKTHTTTAPTFVFPKLSENNYDTLDFTEWVSRDTGLPFISFGQIRIPGNQLFVSQELNDFEELYGKSLHRAKPAEVINYLLPDCAQEEALVLISEDNNFFIVKPANPELVGSISFFWRSGQFPIGTRMVLPPRTLDEAA